jgi:AcrR family transcriptional regulator
MSASSAATLREKQAAATREHLIEKAYDLLVNHPTEPFSHESIAKRADVGARTVYRYFPTQMDIYEEMWIRVRKAAGTVFPYKEEQILPQVPIMFGNFDRNEKLIRTLLESPAGHRVRERGTPESYAAFSQSLEDLLDGRSPTEKRRIIGVFRAIYSAPFWDLLRRRGELSGPDAIAAAEWAMSTLMEGLRTENKKKKRSNPK